MENNPGTQINTCPFLQAKKGVCTACCRELLSLHPRADTDQCDPRSLPSCRLAYPAEVGLRECVWWCLILAGRPGILIGAWQPSSYPRQKNPTKAGYSGEPFRKKKYWLQKHQPARVKLFGCQPAPSLSLLTRALAWLPHFLPLPCSVFVLLNSHRPARDQRTVFVVCGRMALGISNA